jgi:type I restriction enzyme S subunit
MSVSTAALGDLVWAHYGKALKQENRDSTGSVVVYGSSGEVGRHRDALTHEPTIVVGRKGSVGAITFAPNGGWVIDTAYFLERKNPSQLDLRYLFHALRSADLAKDTITTSIPGLNRDDLLANAIRVPKIDDQRHIAAVLDKADSLRRKRQEAIRLADEFLRATFIDLFGDPVTNSQGLPTQRLDSLGALDRGVSKHRPRNDPSLLGGDYPLIQTGDVANCDGYVRTYISTYSEKGLKQSKLWPAGTLCITIAANIAKTGILLFPACFPDSVVGFSAADRPTVEYVRFWLSFLQQTLEANAPASAQKNINLAILRELQIPVPPRDRIERFAAAVDKVEAIRKAQRLALDEGQKLNRALEQALLNP